ncbi:hypothetical protein CFH99_09385 [Nocardioides aromaticivorans]|uniref:Uncharacterized protein n=1 Tax=Nocardioides aromaticivorans TaxID=200618 RepID=A0ABX7PIN7_9ACTN|nr:hypothetical protein [Nocardioides aromaticivorans]QSR25834.1 hypothetical protein CFH99_09385 [Nocardioides aromaticivorans]
MTTYRTRAAALLAAGAVAGGVTAASLSAHAADDTGTTSDSSSATAGEPGPGGPGGPGGHGRGGPVDAAALAKALGVSEDKVSDALDAVRDELRPDADSRPADGEQPTPPTDEERAEREAAFVTALAEELGIDEDKVSDALETLRAAARAEHRTELSDRLDQAVEDGDLTAADKASVLKAFDAGVLGGR